MKRRLFWSLAFRNLKANYILELPFLLSSGLMGSLLFVLYSLLTNDYVRTRHQTLPMLLILADIIVSLLAILFIIYASRLQVKQRNREFALYGVMGLEKRHITRILHRETIIEYIIIATISVVLGNLLGELGFLLLHKLIRDYTAGPAAYHFSGISVIITLGFLMLIFFLLAFYKTWQIRHSNPIELFSAGERGEKEPKVRFVALVLGLIALAIGYGIALRTKTTLSSIFNFFIAVIFVILATYLLFIGLSIAVLKLLRRSKTYYYKPKHFLSISGMLYRMKSHATGLASIAILSTGVILALTSTLVINSNLNSIPKSVMQRDYWISTDLKADASQEEVEEILTRVKAKAQTAFEAGEQAERPISVVSTQFFTLVEKENETLLPVPAREASQAKGAKGMDLISKSMFFSADDLSSYNQRFAQSRQLADDEILVSAKGSVLKSFKTLTLAHKTYRVIPIKEELNNNFAIENAYLVFPSRKALMQATYYYSEETQQSQTRQAVSSVRIGYSFDVKNEGKNFISRLSAVAKANNKAVRAAQESVNKVDTAGIELQGNILFTDDLASYTNSIYELNGGFLYIGGIISIVLLIGTNLLMYYKQVSEGFEDRDRFHIMSQVGMTDKLMRQSSRQQIMWLMFLPLGTAVIHSLFASRILFPLLGLFGERNIGNYFLCMGSVLLVFLFIYLILYAASSRSYHRIIKGRPQN